MNYTVTLTSQEQLAILCALSTRQNTIAGFIKDGSTISDYWKQELEIAATAFAAIDKAAYIVDEVKA